MAEVLPVPGLMTTVFAAPNDAVLVVDAAGTIVDASARADEMFGYQPGGLTGLNLEALLPRRFRAAHAKHRRKFAAGPSIRTMGARAGLAAIRADGSEFPVDVSLSPSPSPDDGLVIAVVRDLTEMVRARAAQQRLAGAVLDCSLDAYHATDDAGVVIAWNRAAEVMYGWSAEEAVGQQLIELVVPERMRIEAAHDRVGFAPAGDSPRVGAITETIGCRRDGSEFPIELVITAVTDGGRVTFHTFTRDISGIKADRAALSLAATVVAASQDAICAIGQDGQVILWNPAMARLSGWSEAEVMGRPLTMFPSFAERLREEDFFNAVLARNTASMVSEHQRKDGSVFTAATTVAPLTDDAGATIGICISMLDISDHRAAQTDLRRAAAIIQGSPQGIAAMDLGGTITLWNPQMETMFGVSANGAIGRSITDVFPAESVVEAASVLETALGGKALSHVQEVEFPDGSRRMFSVGFSPIRDESGAVTGLCGQVSDITDERLAQLQVERVAAVVESSDDAMGAIDQARNVTVWNQAAERMYGYTAAELVGRPFTTFVPPEAVAAATAVLDAAFAGETVSYTQQRRRKDGTPFTMAAKAGPIWGADGTVVGVTVWARDVTEREKLRVKAEEAQATLRAIIDSAPVAIAVRDRDFRYVMTNPAYRRLVDVPSDKPLAGTADVDVVGAAASRRMRVGDHRVLGGETIRTMQVIAVSGTERQIDSQRFPLIGAEGQVVAIAEVATDVTDTHRVERELRERLDWQDHIRSAVAQGLLLVYAQPIIDLNTGALWGEELLVRMLGGHGPRDVVEPREFLPGAEKFGLMPMIDKLVISRAIELARAGRRISVNISATSIANDELAEQVIGLVAAAPDAAANLTFEITETAALASPDVAAKFSEGLALLGANLALDDFGTGYGGFTELRSLRLHSLKIDLSFVQHLATNAEDQRVVKLIIGIAKEFGLTTTAEGVEDADSLELLREYGADRAQGYLIGRPAPVAD